MITEKQIIKLINRIIPSGPKHLNNCFESDSEIIEIGGIPHLFTTDDFSHEDLFRDDDPYILGWNIALGGISDILANGGTPMFYAHTLVVSESWNEKYITNFSKGIADLLELSGATFIGGDIGKSKNWGYTASVIGKLDGKPVIRKGAAAGDLIYMTGKIGAGNFDAALKLYSNSKKGFQILRAVKNKFVFRIAESVLIRDYATSCIDSSDGVFNALNTISEINNTGYEIENLVYLKKGTLAAKLLSVPRILLFFGECGEYELLFTIKEKTEQEFLKKAKNLNLKFSFIGRILEEQSRILIEKENRINLNDLTIRARDFNDTKLYLETLTAWIKENI